MTGIELIYHAINGSRPTGEELDNDRAGWNDVWHYQDEYKRIYEENRIKLGFRDAALHAGKEVIRQIIEFRRDLEAEPNA